MGILNDIITTRVSAAAGLVVVGLLLASCDSFLDRPPQGALSDEVLANEEGAETLLTGAYGALDGQIRYPLVWPPWAGAESNWVWGSIAGADAHKGTEPTDGPNINPAARWSISPSNDLLNNFWIARYEGVDRANSVLSLLSQADMAEAEKDALAAEARFLRGHFYFDLKKMFNMVPWIDEDTEETRQPNDQDIWPMIEEDLQFAMDNLPETQDDVGRANSWAAASYLAKAYVYQEKWDEAKALFDDIIATGMTSNGLPYDLVDHFHDNFNAATENNSESVFAVQAVSEDAEGTVANSRRGDMVSFPFNSPFRCCGFYQPTQDLVNSYRTDSGTGLPLIDAYNGEMVNSDLGVLSTEEFTPYPETLDPRLDWTVGRRGVPFHDWGPHPGRRWVRDQDYSGPYAAKKNVYWRATEDEYANHSEWAPGVAINYVIIRFADVLLMAAEAEAHLGNLEQARTYVNRVRERAANPDGRVGNELNEAYATAVVDSEAEMLATDADEGDWVVRTDRNSTFVLLEGSSSDIDNWNEYEEPSYAVDSYPSSAFSSTEEALEKIYFERKLELAMEGHRFFDLSRWGIAEDVLNDFYEYEGDLTLDVRDARFSAPANLYYPIPQRQIDLSTIDGEPTLEQNPGYAGG